VEGEDKSRKLEARIVESWKLALYRGGACVTICFILKRFSSLTQFPLRSVFTSFSLCIQHLRGFILFSLVYNIQEVLSFFPL
jgi:hypothetical protein